MPDEDLFLRTVEAVYASGLDSSRLPEALETTSRLLKATSATLEIIDKASQRPSEFWSVGLPELARTPYINYFSTLHTRAPFSFRQRAGFIIWDHPFDPFYTEFLLRLGLRYFVGAVLCNSTDKLSVVSVQRTQKQGHVDNREIALITRLVPHFQRARSMASRLKAIGDNLGLLENSLHWLADGAALIRADGTIIYANETLQALAQRGDGFQIVDRALEFIAPNARRRFETALGAVLRHGDPSVDPRSTDFPVPRDEGLPAYIVSVRPLFHDKAPAAERDAEIMVLIRDPLLRSGAASQILQELFGLTNAESHLAEALCTGVTTGAYASERHVSLNTVYSHLKRIREKTGCKSLPDLIRKFGELNVPLRPED